MLSSNMLSLVADFLTYDDLCAFAQLNRQCNSVASRAELWKRECIRLFTSDQDLFGDVIGCPEFPTERGHEPDWKKLVQRGVCQMRHWGDLADFAYMNADDLQLLKQEFFDSLKAPLLPTPTLRRESVTLLSSTLQEMLADCLTTESNCRKYASLSESIVQTLDEYANELFHEFDMPIEQDLLLAARWNLHLSKRFKNDSAVFSLKESTYSNASTSHTAGFEEHSVLEQTYLSFPLKESQPFLLRLYSVIKDSVAFHCKLSSEMLRCQRDLWELCSNYVIAWNAFCASAHKIDSDFKAFSSLLNDICNAKREDMPKCPPFSVMRLMAIVWRRKVLTPVKDKLVHSVLLLLSRQRDHTLSTFRGYKSFCQPCDLVLGKPMHNRQQQSELQLLCKLVQALLDLSVNEISIHFTRHTQFYTDGPYASLEQSTISASFNFYTTLKDLPPDLCSQVLKEDLNLVKMVFLPVTAFEVEKLSLYFDMECWRNFFAQMYFTFRPENSLAALADNLVSQLTESPFGQTISRLQPHLSMTGKPRKFIEHLRGCCHRYISVINHYNEDERRLEALKRKQLQDVEIVKFNQGLALSLDQSPEERMLFSLAQDLSPSQLESILKDLQLLVVV